MGVLEPAHVLASQLVQDVGDTIVELLGSFSGSAPPSVFVTGHSMGGSIAALTALYLLDPLRTARPDVLVRGWGLWPPPLCLSFLRTAPDCVGTAHPRGDGGGSVAPCLGSIRGRKDHAASPGPAGLALAHRLAASGRHLGLGPCSPLSPSSSIPNLAPRSGRHRHRPSAAGWYPSRVWRGCNAWSRVEALSQHAWLSSFPVVCASSTVVKFTPVPK